MDLCAEVGYSCYDKGKRVAEKLLKHKEGLPTQSMRICRDINIFRVIGLTLICYTILYSRMNTLDCLRLELWSTNFFCVVLCDFAQFFLDTPLVSLHCHTC